MINQPISWTYELNVREGLEHVDINIPGKASEVKAFDTTGLGRERLNQLTATGINGDLEEAQDSTETRVTIQNPPSSIQIEYQTAGPSVDEEVINSKRKRITIDSNFHVTDILSFATIPEAPENKIKLFRVTGGVHEETEITDFLDSDNNGLIDRIEWVTPHLSTQEYEIIIITKAQHLDENKDLIKDIYDRVYQKDGLWSDQIYEDQYVRVYFEKNLTSENDITVFVRNNQSLNTRLEVYTTNGTEPVASFPIIDLEDYYKVFLSDLEEPADTFDLKVVNDDPGNAYLEFDLIIDPEEVGGPIYPYKASITTTGTENSDTFDVSKTNSNDCSQFNCNSSNSWKAGFDDQDPANTQITWYFDTSNLGIHGSHLINLTMWGGGCWTGGGLSSFDCDGLDDAEFAAGSSPQLQMQIYNFDSGKFEDFGSGYEITDGGHTSSGPGADYQKYNRSKTSSFVNGHVHSNGTMIIQYNITGDMIGSAYDAIGVYDFAYITVNYDPCSTITQDLTLQRDFNASGTCITVGANHLVIDGNGYTITGDGTGYGVYDSGGYDNITIKNFGGINNFSMGIRISSGDEINISNNSISPTDGSSKYGIRFYNSQNSNVELNTITTQGSSGYGVYLSTNTDDGRFAYNTITTSGSSATGIFLASSTTERNYIKGNNIQTSQSGARGIYLRGSDHIIEDNILDSSSSNSIYTDSSNRGGNIFLNNNMSAGSTLITDTSGNSYTNFLVYNNSFGEIRWSEDVNDGFLKDMDISGDKLGLGINLFIGNNVVALNTSHFGTNPPINSSANITLHGLSLDDVDEIRQLGSFSTSSGEVRNSGTTCSAPSCNILDYTGGTLLFDTIGFSSFAGHGQCGPITEDTTLGEDMTSSGTCFTIEANDVTLDCAGHTISYSTGVGGYGVSNIGYDNVTIKNCVFQQDDSDSDEYGIYFESASNGLITNNTIITSGSGSYGIRGRTSVTNNIISHNTAQTSGTLTAGIYISSSANDNTIQFNMVTGSATSGHGIRIDSGDRNRVEYNNVSVTGSSARALYIASSSEDNVLLNNNLSSPLSSEILDSTGNSYTNFLVYNNSFGQIRWSADGSGEFLRDIDVRDDIGLGTNLFIGPNVAALDTVAFSSDLSINSSANITLYNLSQDTIIEIFEEPDFVTTTSSIIESGKGCTGGKCQIVSYSSGTLDFTTNGFSSFSGLNTTRPRWSSDPPNQTLDEDTRSGLNLTSYVEDDETAATDLIFYVVDENASEVNCITDFGNGNLTIFPAENWNGVGSCSIVVSDGILNSTAMEIQITINSVNDLPEVHWIRSDPIPINLSLDFACKANVTDVESEIGFVNFSIFDPNGTAIINNVNGSFDGDVWSSSSLTPSNGAWNCSIVAFDGTESAVASAEIPIDLDNDGYTIPNDCQDTNSSINPSAEDVCDNLIDEDCNGIIDQGCDFDRDSILNENDNCAFDFNSDQTDSNGDGVGDACNVSGRILSQSFLQASDLENQYDNDSDWDSTIFYANQLGYTTIVNATEFEGGEGMNYTFLVLSAEDQSVIYAVNIHGVYVQQNNASYAYCVLNNGTSCNATGEVTNETLSMSFLVELHQENDTVTIFNRHFSGVINLTDGSIISSWGETGSCSAGLCTISCIADNNFGSLDALIEAILVNEGVNQLCDGLALACLAEGGPACAGVWGACQVIIGAITTIGSCPVQCWHNPCAYGHECDWYDDIDGGEVRNFACDGDTAVWEECRDDGQAWVDQSEFCENGCIENSGVCRTICQPGVKCRDDNTRAFQNVDCSWSNPTFCELGCDEETNDCRQQGEFCPNHAPFACNDACYGCENGFSLCCPADGSEPSQCCGPDSFCQADGTCAAQCQEGYECQDANTLGYRFDDCSWDEETEACANGCIQDGNGEARCQVDSCEEGWKCQDADHRGYQDEDCDWSSVSECEHGCSDGACRAEVGEISSCTIEMDDGGMCRFGRECEDWSWDRRETGRVDGNWRPEWSLAKFDFDWCSPGLTNDDILSARLDFTIFSSRDENIRNTDLRVYQGCSDNDVDGRIRGDEEDCLLNIGNDPYSPVFYPHVVERVDDEVNPCDEDEPDCGVDVTNAIVQYADWDDEDEITFAWWPEDDQDLWQIDHQPDNPTLYLEYPFSCSVASDCGQDRWISGPYCLNDDVYRTYRTHTCDSPDCFHSDNPLKFTECGVDSTGDWGNYFCDGANINQSRFQYDRGCNGGQCSFSISSDYQTVTTCASAEGNEGTAHSSVCADGFSTCQDSCKDGLDNDGDGALDCQDSACQAASHCVSQCQYVNENITLYSNVTSSGTCFVVNASNIEIDCQGFMINYSTGTKFSHAINNSRFDNVTVKNCIIVEGENVSGNSEAILFEDSSGGLIYSNLITTEGANSTGIEIRASNATSVIGNNITTSGVKGEGMSFSPKPLVQNNVSNNNILTHGFRTPAFFGSIEHGVFSENKLVTKGNSTWAQNFGSVNGTILNNNVTTLGWNSIAMLLIVQNSTFASNFIVSNNTDGLGIGITLLSSEGNTFTENIVYSLQDASPAMVMQDSDSNIVNETFLWTTNVNSVGLRLQGTSRDNILLNNKIIANQSYEIIDDNVTSPNRIIYSNTYGKIEWLDNGSGSFVRDSTLNATNSVGIGHSLIQDTGNVRISINVASLNTSAFDVGKINSSANITLNGLVFHNIFEIDEIEKDPDYKLWRNAVNGPDCLAAGTCEVIDYNTSANAGRLIFNTTSFSSFSVNDN